MELNGYINYNNQQYTFNFNGEKLVLLNFEPEINPFGENRYIEYLEGFTIDGRGIWFYINQNVFEYNKSYTCYPSCIMCYQGNKEYKMVSELEFDTLCFSGGIINSFYSNLRVVERDSKTKKHIINEEKIQETILEEPIDCINGNMELSIMYRGYKYRKRISFTDNNSLLRIKYNKKKCINEIFKNIKLINELIYFCSNRKNVMAEKIYLESHDDGIYKKECEIFIIKKYNDIESIEDIIEYDMIKGCINQLLELLQELKYPVYAIPKNSKNFKEISPSEYTKQLSNFESIYEYMQKKQGEEMSEEEKIKELLPSQKLVVNLLKYIQKDYKGNKNRKDKDWIKKTLNNIINEDKRLDFKIQTVIAQNKYVIDTLHYTYNNFIKESDINTIIQKGITERNLITHSDVKMMKEEENITFILIRRINVILILQ